METNPLGLSSETLSVFLKLGYKILSTVSIFDLQLQTTYEMTSLASLN